MYKKPFSSDSRETPKEAGAIAPPFQSELPKTMWLAQAANDLAYELEQDAHAIYLLQHAAVGIALGGTTSVELDSGYRTPASIFAMTIAEPGSKKSETVKRVKRPVLDTILEVRASFEQHNTEYEICEKQLKGLLRRAEKATSIDERKELCLQADELKMQARHLAMPDNPFFDNISPAALASLLAKNKVAAHLADEPVLIDTAQDHAKNGLRVFIHPWDKGDGGFDTVTRGRQDYSGSTLNIGIFSQPDKVLEAFNNRRLRGSGFLDRFLLRNATSPAPFLDKSLMPGITQRHYAEVVRTLVMGWYGQPVKPEFIIKLSPEAQATYDVYVEICKAIRREEQYRQAQDINWLSKYPGQLLRVAAINHAFQNPAGIDTVRLDGETMLEAKRFVTILMEDMINYHFGFHAQTEHMENMIRKLLEIITQSYPDRQRATFTCREIYKPRGMNSGETLTALYQLAARGTLKLIHTPRQPGKAGQPPSPRFAWPEYFDPNLIPPPHYPTPYRPY
jgi:hypothetical protein